MIKNISIIILQRKNVIMYFQNFTLEPPCGKSSLNNYIRIIIMHELRVYHEFWYLAVPNDVKLR